MLVPERRGQQQIKQNRKIYKKNRNIRNGTNCEAQKDNKKNIQIHMRTNEVQNSNTTKITERHKKQTNKIIIYTPSF